MRTWDCTGVVRLQQGMLRQDPRASMVRASRKLPAADDDSDVTAASALLVDHIALRCSAPVTRDELDRLYGNVLTKRMSPGLMMSLAMYSLDERTEPLRARDVVEFLWNSSTFAPY